MSKNAHFIYVWSMVLVVVLITVYLAQIGHSYYTLPIEERFYHDQYNWLKPSGLLGQGLGVVGTFLIAFGVFIYIARKRYGFLERFIRLKYLLEFHIFLCTLGPILILFHTTFKFGGIVAIAFWSMTAVVLSGVIGRFIYIQIPRTIEGRELTIHEVRSKKREYYDKISAMVGDHHEILSLLGKDEENHKWGLSTYFKNRQDLSKLRKSLRSSGIENPQIKNILQMAREEMNLTSKISRLEAMQNLFKYWHVIHMPFAIIMLIIVIIHIAVAITLGYKWIF